MVAKLNIKYEHEIKIKRKLILLEPGSYEFDAKILKQFDFIKCHKCKEYFDEVSVLSPYYKDQIKYLKYVDNDYCETCYNKTF